MKAASVITTVGVVSVLTGVLLVANPRIRETRADEYDADGNATERLLCPSTIPTTDPGWNTFLMPMRFLVPAATWDNNAGGGVGGWRAATQRIPFWVDSFRETALLGPALIGSTWYVPTPTQTYYSGLDYAWEGPGASQPPAAFAVCYSVKRLWGLYVAWYVYFPGDPFHIQGFAFPLNIGDDNDTCDGGDGGGGVDDSVYATTRAPNDAGHLSATRPRPPSGPSLDCTPNGGGGGVPTTNCHQEYIEIQIQLDNDPDWITIWSGYASVCDYAE